MPFKDVVIFFWKFFKAFKDGFELSLNLMLWKVLENIQGWFFKAFTFYDSFFLNPS